MVAAEAAASGLPLIVPSDGGASDQALALDGWRYRSGSAAGAAHAITEFASNRMAETPVSVSTRPPAPRTMADHFAELFAHYQAAQAPRVIAA